MAKILERAPQEFRYVIAEARRRWHGELDQAEVTIDAYVASRSSDDESDAGKPALTLHGYPCAAVVKITPYEQRVKGVSDAVITFDRRDWDGRTFDERLALVDHELAHLVVAKDKDGFVKSDEHGRPKLKMRLHDVQAGWFMDVADRHGMASAEVQQARDIQTKWGQLLFSFAEGPPPKFLAQAVKEAGLASVRPFRDGDLDPDAT